MTYGPDLVRSRTAALLVAGAIASTLLAATSYWVQRSLSGQTQISGKVLPDFAAQMPQIATITISTRTGTYTLVRSGSAWVMPERGNYPIASAALSSLAKGLSDLKFKAARTSDPAQFARLGVDEPNPDSNSVLVSFKGPSGQEMSSLYLGKKADALFVRKLGSNDVFEAEGAMPDLTAAPLWLDLNVVDITPETIASVSGQNVGEAPYDIVRRPDGGFAPVGGQANVTATTAAIAVTKFAPVDVMPAKALTQNAIARHTTTLRSGMIITLTAYRQDSRNWVVVSATATRDDQNESAARVNQRSDGWAFELGDTEFADLTFPRDAILAGPVTGNQN